MILASREEAEALIKQTREWAEKHTMFSSSKGAATLAAAEYTLNMQGKTLYPYIAAKTGE